MARRAVVLLRSAALGLASGGRSTAGLAALALTAPPRPRVSRAYAQPASFLQSDRASRAAVVAAAGELVADKLPRTPSRLAAPGLATRVLAGTLCGVVVAQRSRLPAAVPGAVGGGCALLGSLLGARVRGRAPSSATAVAEDVVSLGLAYAAARE